MKHGLTLYIAGCSPKSELAQKNLKVIVEQYLKGEKCKIEVVDLLKNPLRVAADSIFATPALVIQSSLHRQVVLGDLSDTDKVLSGLGLSI